MALARALIAQAIRHDSTLLSYVYEESATSGERPLSTTKRAEDILKIAVKSLGKIYIVIDGLDECKDTEKSKIVSWLKNKANNEIQNEEKQIKFLLLSQVDRETDKLLKFVPQFSIGQAGLTRDIRRFCEIEGTKIRRKFDLADPEYENIVQNVAQRAQGTSHVTI